ncbi:hypothetical protein N7541_006730 [Penicillium brevicompactum]|uniref:Uncharacterized protein n=1 Tax=Penicillium brevicompactum TaxID=5074 RepID=A0A9W9R5P8_PENBR|nr:uncharacterized protein N7506_011611 [Penicillium brevicompactum]KAJ5318907.1 hypothetical protein N7506_011611 [Penicillium brevicompactum]KAJ5322491.1 hypothetical protein N7452_010780 [Penicillium brevicompactum]KAJ5354166.1 hypothetical protein N7541_006730 [Penicillium brevicompactum]
MARQTSLDSERPMMAQSNRASKRFSTVSGSPSLAASDRTNGSLPSGDPRIADISHLHEGFERLENKPLTKQRFVPTAEKSDNLNKLALGAKVERALGRRMTGQDAVMRKPLSEKSEGTTSP